jgi:hypothetical protein
MVTSTNDKDVRIPDTIDGLPVTTVGRRANFDWSGVTSVTIPSSVTTIEYAAFEGASTSLTSVTFTSPSSLKTIDSSAFANCRNLESITIPSSVTTIGKEAFSNSYYQYNQSKLSSVTFASPSSVTTIGEKAFLGNINLTSIIIPNSVTTIGDGAFNYCTGLKTITIGSSVTNIAMNYVFGTCTGLTEINVDQRNSKYSSVEGVVLDKNGQTLIFVPRGKSGAYTIPSTVTNIDDNAILNCPLLTSVTIPSSVTLIKAAQFRACTNLTSVTIPSSVRSIGISSFRYCGLTSVTIPASVTTLEAEAFWDCPNLTSVTFAGTIAESNFAISGGAPTFTGDLREKYLAGGPGTYTTTAPAGSRSVWTKQ